jgi:hypothetical protein
VLLAASLVLLRLSVASDTTEAGKWLVDGGRRTSAVIGLYLIPFAGIAFLWFMGVIRDQMGEREDKFFATVFMGSGLLFVALLFAGAAIAIGLFAMFHAAPANAAENATWTFGRNMTSTIMNVFAIRMAAVFMISTSTIALRTEFINRWLAFPGYAIALVLLFVSGSVDYVYLLMPLWVFLVSMDVLVRSLRKGSKSTENILES